MAAFTRETMANTAMEMTTGSISSIPKLTAEAPNQITPQPMLASLKMCQRRLSATRGESAKDESGWATAQAAKGADAISTAAGTRPTLGV